jgi:hypothetical protein
MSKLYIKNILLVLIALILLCSVGCAEYGIGVSTEPDSLKVLTPEEIESIFAEISIEEKEKYPSETDESGREIVFWLDGGSVWHVSQLCSSIKKADPSVVKNGSVADAQNSGKERPCKICGSDFEYTEITVTTNHIDVTAEVSTDSETQKYPREYGEDGEIIVFWLEGGKVWHWSRQCSSLSRSNPEKIIKGSVSDAINAGKERACKNCSE